MVKKIFAFLMLFVFIYNPAVFSADSILGNKTLDNYSIEIGNNTVYERNEFYSLQEGVGYQTENIVYYKPNELISPIITYGEYLYGRKDINEINNYLLGQGKNTAAGVNGGFYSLQTGVPIGHMLQGNKIITKQGDTLSAIGIRQDNSAFIDELEIVSDITFEDVTIPLYNINKYRQPNFLYMFDSRFAPTTKTKGEGLFIELQILSGEMKINSSLKAKVTKIETKDGEIEIPKDKLILSYDMSSANTYLLEQLNLIKEDDILEISFSADEKWEDLKYVLASEGKRLIKNGEISSDIPNDSAAPRTVFCIKEDGTQVFYTIDGRQKGYSYGLRQQTLAKRLKELGLDKIVFDFQAGNPEIYNQIMGTKNYYTYLASSLIKATSQGLKTDVHFIPTKINYKELPEIIDLLNIANCENLSILNFVPQGRGEINKEDLLMSTEEMQEFTKIYEDSKTYLKEKTNHSIMNLWKKIFYHIVDMTVKNVLSIKQQKKTI